jgi:hypothetical protein
MTEPLVFVATNGDMFPWDKIERILQFEKGAYKDLDPNHFGYKLTMDSGREYIVGSSKELVRDIVVPLRVRRLPPREDVVEDKDEEKEEEKEEPTKDVTEESTKDMEETKVFVDML